jgi:hypothetical protein
MKLLWYWKARILSAVVAAAAVVGSVEWGFAATADSANLNVSASATADSAKTASTTIASVQSTDVASKTNATASDQPASAQPATAQSAFPEKVLPAKVLLIVTKNSPECDKVLGQLMRPSGDFDKMRAAGWKIGKGAGNQLQIVDKDDVPDLVAQLGKPEFPAVASVDKSGEVVRYFRFGCTTPLDMWTFGFLAKGIDERPAGFVMESARVEWTGHYPLRGNHWSVEGDWSPSKEKTVEHLHGPVHQSQLIPQWHIEEWSLEELRSLHDDLHEKYDTGTYNGSGNSGGSSGGADYLKYKGKG